jgi:cell division septation protein DedD
VQVAALTEEVEARKLSDRLRQENFQAFVGTLPADSYYRVMLGPYADQESARIVLGKLKRAGFSSFIRRESVSERLGSQSMATPGSEPAI